MFFHQPGDLVPRDPDERRLLHRFGELFALSAVEDRQLTEQFAGIDQRQNRLFAFRSDVVQLDSPGGEQKDRFAGFGGHVDETASRQLLRLRDRFESRDVLRRETLEQIAVLQVPELLIHAGDAWAVREQEVNS